MWSHDPRIAHLTLRLSNPVSTHFTDETVKVQLSGLCKLDPVNGGGET